MVETDHYFIVLPTESSGEPDIALAIGASDLHEAGIIDTRIRVAEMRGIRQVVELGPELKF